MTGVMNIPRHAGDEFLVCQTALRNTQNAASIRNCSIPAAYGVPAHLSRNYNVQHGVVFRFTPPVCNTSGVTTHSTIQRRSRLPPRPQHPLCTDDRYRMAIRRRYDDSTPNLSRISPQSPGNSSGGIQPCALSVPPPPRARQWRASPLHWPRNAVALR